MVALSAAAWVWLAAQGAHHPHHESVAADLTHWSLMVAAMMLPLQVRAVRLTAERTLWTRRDRSIAGFVAGYGGVWAIAGLMATSSDATLHLRHRLDWTACAALGLTTAGAWLVSPWKARAARQCHQVPQLSPAGWRADRDAVRYGAISAWRCGFNCWPLMLGCWLFGHSMAVMAPAFGLGWADRHFRPRYKVQAILLCGAGSALWLYGWARP